MQWGHSPRGEQERGFGWAVSVIGCGTAWRRLSVGPAQQATQLSLNDGGTLEMRDRNQCGLPVLALLLPHTDM